MIPWAVMLPPKYIWGVGSLTCLVAALIFYAVSTLYVRVDSGLWQWWGRPRGLIVPITQLTRRGRRYRRIGQLLAAATIGCALACLWFALS